MLEKMIERKVCLLAQRAGWETFKWSSPSQRGVPDRIFIREGVVVFIEFKATGKRPTLQQEKMIARLRAQGMTVHVCDSVESGCDALTL